MRAILARPAGGFGLTEVEPPLIGPGELLLEVKACGLCGTDLTKLAQPDSAGVILGHELSGVVRQVGPAVERFRTGDHVVAAHHVPCGGCWACRHGHDSMCQQFKATNLDPGGFAQFVRLSAPHVAGVTFPLPAGMPFEVAAFTEPLACAVRAVDRAEIQAGDRIGVAGGGGMGLLIAQVLRARGADPVVVEISEARLALARSLGLQASVNPSRQDVARAVHELTGGVGLDGMILTVVSKAILAQAQRLVRAGARLTIFAGPGDGPELPVDMADLYHRELSVSAAYSASPAALAEALDLLATDRVRVIPLITHRLPLGAFEEGVRLQRDGRATKVIFQP